MKPHALLACPTLLVLPLLALPQAAMAEDTTPPEPAIVVTATPFRHAQDETPSIPAKVDAAQIRQTGGASLADALKNVPGVSASGFAQGASRPIIRGMDSNRVRLLEDGTSLADVSDIGPDHGTPIDPLSARSVEVVRGAATLRYGSQAIGGVINTLNNRVPTSLPANPLSGELTTSYATANRAGEVAGLVDGKTGDLALHADAYLRRTGDYDTPQGRQANSFFKGWGGSAGGSYFFGGGSHAGLAVTHYDAQFGIPSDTTYIDMRQTKIITRNVIEVGAPLLKSLHLDGAYGDYQHREKNPDGSVNSTFTNKELNLRGEALFNRMGAITNLALGSEYQHRDFAALGAGADYLLPATSDNLAAYVFSEVALAKALHLEGSARIERVRITGTPASGTATRRVYTPASAALGLLLDAGGGMKWGLTASTTTRAPALTELFARGGHDGPQTYETGDPNLKGERAKALELTLRVHRGAFRFDGSLYSTWFSDYIYGDLTGRTCDDVGLCAAGNAYDLREVFYRQQGAHFRGIEAEARYDLVKTGKSGLTARLMGDLTRTTLDDGQNVPRIAPWRIGGGLDWESPRWDAGVAYTRYATQHDYGRFDTPTQGYNALSAHVAVRPFTAHPGVEFSVVGQNLTDDVQRYATSFNKALVMAMGRSIRLVARIASF